MRPIGKIKKKNQNSVKLLTKVQKNNLQKKQCNYVLTHTVTDWFYRAITPTHTDAPIVSFVYATCIKNGRQCTKYRHI